VESKKCSKPEAEDKRTSRQEWSATSFLLDAVSSPFTFGIGPFITNKYLDKAVRTLSHDPNVFLSRGVSFDSFGKTRFVRRRHIGLVVSKKPNKQIL
jgi:hypothetical protein